MTAKHKSKNRKLQFQKWDKKTVLVSFVFLVLITLISSSFFSSSEGEGVTGFVVKKISVRAFEQLKSEAITARSKAESTRNQEDIIQAIRLYEQLIASGRVTSGQIRNYKGRIQQLDWLEPSTPLHVSTGGREAHVGQAEPGTTGDIRSASPSSSESGTGGDVAPVDSVLLQQAQQRLNTAKEEAQKFDNLRIKVGMGKEAFMDYYYERNDPLTIEYKQVHALYDQAEKKDEAEGWGEESPVPPELKKALDNVNDFSRIRKQYREEKASGQISPLVQAEYNKLREKYPFDDAKYEADFDEAKKAFDAQTNAENIFNRLQKEETVEKQYQQAITTYRTAQTSEDPEQQTLLLAQAARDLKLVERYYTEEGNAETAKKIQDELDNLLWRVISTPTRVPVDPATFTDSAQRQSAEMLNGAINEYGEKQTALSEAEQAESQCWFFCGEEEKARAQAEADVDRAGNTLRFQQLQFRLETAPSAIAEAPPSPKPETGGSLAYQVTELRSQARSVVDPAEKRRLLEQAATLAVESAKKYQEEDNLIGASGVLRLGRQSIEEAADLTAVPSVPPVAEAPPVPAPPVVVPKNAISAEDRSPVTALQNCRELNIVESCEVKDIGGRKYAVPTAQAEAFKQRQDAATERATQLASLAEGWTTGSEEGEIADLVRGVSDEDLPLLNQKFNEATGQELDDVLKDELGDEVYASLRGTPAPAPTPPEPAPPPERNALQITKPDGGGTFELDCTKHPDQCQKLRTISERLATAIVRERPKILGELRIAKLEAHNLVSPPPAGEAPLAAAPSASEPSSASAPLIEPLHAVATYGIQRAILDDTNYAIIVSELSDGTQLTAIFDDQGKRIGYQKPDGNFVRGEPEGGWPDAIADTISLQSASLQSVTR
ncbi:TPA: hypothetical protein HA249_04305, partial [Candidatus Woesearchaeota archaeon]|nr:hypothetical protein [Candidatus Woesearchaeota archaeon]